MAIGNTWELLLLDKSVPLPWCGCWIWLGSIGSKGYGRYGNQLAHRLSYETFVGPIFQENQIAHLHRCASRLCINPEHLIQLTVWEHRTYDLYNTLPQRYTFGQSKGIPT